MFSATFKASNKTGFYQFSLSDYPGTCIDCKNCQAGSPPLAWNCVNNAAQFWTLDAVNSKSVLFQSHANASNCMEVIGEYYLTMAKCNKSNINQQFMVNSPSNEYVSAAYNSSLCYTMGGGLFNCTMSQFKDYPYCNQMLPTYQRVDDLVGRMNTYEKAQNLALRTNEGVARLGMFLS